MIKAIKEIHLQINNDDISAVNTFKVYALADFKKKIK